MSLTIPVLNKHGTKKRSLVLFLNALFIISLQIQWSFSFTDSQIRIGISDLILPILLLVLWKNPEINKSELNRQDIGWSFSWLPLWLILFSTWLGVSLLLGIVETGKLSHWALINKFFGWFALIGYLYVGRGMSALEKLEKHESFNHESYNNDILKVALCSSATISLLSCVISLLNIHFNRFGIDDIGRFTGLLANANAYGIFSAFMILMQIPFFKEKKLFSPYAHGIILLLNILALVYSASRGAWLMLGIGLSVLLYLKVFTFRKTMLFILVLSISTIFLSSFKNGSYLSSRLNHIFVADDSAIERVNVAKQALLYWQTSPLTGIGLGSFVAKQTAEKENFSRSPSPIQTQVGTIHSTFLWLLTETGLIGLGIFLLFFLKIIQVTFRKLRSSGEADMFSEGVLFAQGFLAASIGLTMASFTSELLYQRYLWFFLGIVLVSKQLSKTEKTSKVSSPLEVNQAQY